jgi:hypothetical protein
MKIFSQKFKVKLFIKNTFFLVKKYNKEIKIEKVEINSEKNETEIPNQQIFFQKGIEFERDIVNYALQKEIEKTVESFKNAIENYTNAGIIKT